MGDEVIEIANHPISNFLTYEVSHERGTPNQVAH
jgi:hypothetical protein